MRAARAIRRMRQPIDSARSLSAGLSSRDAAHQEAVGPHPGAERAVGEDRQLGGGVGAVEIGRRIGFGKAQGLRFLHRLVERQLLLLHPGHHEVAGAVEDAGQAVDLVGAMTQVPDDRQRRGRRGFAVQRRRRALRQHAQLGELRGEQRLVGGDHRLAGGQRRREDRLHRRAAGHLDDDVHGRIADQVQRPVGERDARGQRAARLGQVAHGDPRHPEAHAVAIGHGGVLAFDHLEQPAADRAAADHADAQLAHRLDAHALEARPGADGRRAAERAGAAQQLGQPVLIGQEGVVAVERVERPQRRLRAGGLELAVQLHLQRPRKQHVAGHADDDGVGGDPLEQGAPGARIGADCPAIDRLAEHQEGLHREALGEAPAVVLEVLGDRRPFEAGLERAEAGVELVAAAVGEHAELAGPAHAGGDVAVADGVADQLALQVPGGRAPAVGPQPGRDGDQPAAALGVAHRERHADHAAEAGPDEGHRRGAAAAVEPRRHQVGQAEHRDRRQRVRPSSKPRQVEPLPGQHGQSTVIRAGSMRSALKSAGHHGSVPPCASPLPSPSGNGDAVMPPTITTTGAVPSSGP